MKIIITATVTILVTSHIPRSILCHADVFSSVLNDEDIAYDGRTRRSSVSIVSGLGLCPLSLVTTTLFSLSQPYQYDIDIYAANNISSAGKGARIRRRLTQRTHTARQALHRNSSGELWR